MDILGLYGRMCLERWIMFGSVVLLLVACVIAQNQPPRIKQEWKSTDYYKVNSNFIFSCEATGIPDPKYFLLKNDRVIREQDEYQFTLTNIDQSYEGVYQCKASNLHGNSQSRKTVLKMATQVLFDKTNIAKTLKLSTSKLSLECKPQIFPILPPGEYKWFRKVDGSQTTLENSKFMQIDHEGTVHFSNMYQLKKNFQSFYCETKNTFLDQWAKSGETQVTITNINDQSESLPQLMTSSSESLVAEDESPTVRCLFSGYPTPDITWHDANDLSTELSPMDWQRSFDNTHITYTRKLAPSVIKSIVCKGKNKLGEMTQEIKINLKPRFLRKEDELKDVTLNEGDDALLRCVSRAEPAATIKWFKNGEELDDTNMPANYKISNDRSELSITGACKLCDKPDLAVIQYQAENAHGSVYSEATVNVLEKTTIDVEASTLKDVDWLPDQNVSFNVVANGDALVPLQYKWFFNDVEIIKDKDPRLEVNEGSLKILMEGDTEGGVGRCGSYKCQVDNGYSSSELSANLINPGIGAAGFAWWWILLIVLLILFLLILLLCLFLWCWGCFACCTKQGEDYKVDETERSKGLNPVKELREKGAIDYNSAIVSNNDNPGAKFYNENYNNKNSIKSKTGKNTPNSFQNLAYNANDDGSNYNRHTNNINISQIDNIRSDQTGVYSISRQAVQGRNSRRKSNGEAHSHTIQHTRPIRSVDNTFATERYVSSDRVNTEGHDLKKWSRGRTDLRNEALFTTRIQTIAGPGYVDRDDDSNYLDSDDEDSYGGRGYRVVHERNARVENTFNGAKSSGGVDNCDSFSFQNPAVGDLRNNYTNFNEKKYSVKQQSYEINA